LHNNEAKIADFGFARIVNTLEEKHNWSIKGTPMYMAPELFAKKKYCGKCDVFSLGILFYEVLFYIRP